jgi:16S rRNA (cytosine967-C5)-methyltransferase
MSPARSIAFHILQRVQQGGYAADLLLRDSAPLDSRDAALAETLVFGCLRYQAQLDFLIEVFSGRPKPKLDEEVRIALRLGIYQLRYLNRIPAHAAVAESVDLVKLAHKRSAAGFVNAVLRKVHRRPLAWPDRATGLSVPQWMLDRWERQFGADRVTAIASAALAEPETAVNPATGRAQDAGSRFIVPLLEIEPGMLVLDLCAAPGNKTAQALAAGGRVVACDRSFRRLKEVPAAAMRVALDASMPLPFSLKFDRILVDAPCTGTGTLARNPEIKWRLQAGDIDRLAALQRSILKHAVERLKPGGRLVYSTCSLEPEENEAVAAGLPPEWKLVSAELRLPGRDPQENSPGDGFFAAVIEGRPDRLA